MQTLTEHPESADSIRKRASMFFEEHRQTIHAQTDRLFAGLLIFEWMAAIAGAMWLTPYTWVGGEGLIHLHVKSAVFLGAIISILPVILSIHRPGQTLTRHMIAVSQMLFSALLIHITGGRIETHFHVFGSLAFLAFYRDWRVLISASAVVAADHCIRGLYWPQSVFGVLAASPWRWLEHAGWVVFEDIFLIRSCLLGVKEMKTISQRRAELEETNARIESTVVERTAELRRAIVAAKDADRSKSEFLANMSHEIRTPMTAILGFADNLLERDLSSEDRMMAVSTIQKNGHHLLRIINEILDLSKIEAGKLQVEYLPCSPVKIVAEIQSLMQVRAQAAGLSFDVEMIPPVPQTILTDPTRLRQILINLVGNALKFSKVGGVRLVVSLRGADTDHPLIRFDVIDTGIGLTEAQIGRLFDPFTQADNSTTREFGGTGLGLSISKRLAVMLGGDITVTSTPGQGATFSVEIATGLLNGVPMVERIEELSIEYRETTSPTPMPLDGRLTGLRILLAEDGRDNQRLITFILEKAGAKVDLAEDGNVALQTALRSMQEHRLHDVILLDMQMPYIDGYGVASILRERGYPHPIIALTAHAMAGDREKCLHAGCDDYLAKPIDRAKLMETIRRHVRRMPVESQACALTE